MTVLVDSDILIEVMRARNSSIVESWRKLKNSEALLVYSPISVAELWRGVRPSEITALTHFFEVLVCIPIDRETGRLAGELMRQFGASHSVEIADALIAAGAMTHGAELWTRNRKHYPADSLRFFQS